MVEKEDLIIAALTRLEEANLRNAERLVKLDIVESQVRDLHQAVSGHGSQSMEFRLAALEAELSRMKGERERLSRAASEERKTQIKVWTALITAILGAIASAFGVASQ